MGFEIPVSTIARQATRRDQVEKECVRQGDQLALRRQELPWVPFALEDGATCAGDLEAANLIVDRRPIMRGVGRPVENVEAQQVIAAAKAAGQ